MVLLKFASVMQGQLMPMQQKISIKSQSRLAFLLLHLRLLSGLKLRQHLRRVPSRQLRSRELITFRCVTLVAKLRYLPCRKRLRLRMFIKHLRLLRLLLKHRPRPYIKRLRQFIKCQHLLYRHRLRQTA